MRKLFYFVFIYGFLSWMTPAIAEIIFYDDCEDVWLEKIDWIAAGNKGGNSISVSSEKKRAGRSSYKFILAKYGNAGSETNVELILRGLNAGTQVKNFIFNKEYWMGYSVFIPSDFDFPDNNYNSGLIGQWHAAYDDCDTRPQSQPLGFGLNRDSQGLTVSIASKAAQCGETSYTRRISIDSPKLLKGQWNDIVLNYKFSYGTGGFVKMWMNGKQVVNDSGPNSHNDAKGPYFKMGIYGWADTNMVVYYDEIRIGDQNSSYSEVAPQGVATTENALKLEPPVLTVIQSR